jgi:rod shape-determining protein MreC
MPAGKSGDRREIVVLVGCLAISAGLFAFGSRLDASLVTRIELGLLWPANQVRQFLESVARDHKENEALRIEVTQLRVERLLLLRAGAEYERLRRTLDFAAPRGPVLCPARVMMVAGEPWPLSFQVSAGSRRGVRVGQAVVAPEGLVGRVADVGPEHSTVTLLTDPNLAVAAEVIPSGVRGVLRFRAEEKPGLYLTNVPLTDTVRVGESVATSGLSQLFPEGVPVGTVTRLGRDPGGLIQEIEVRPAAPLTRLREVFVVLDTARLVPWDRAVHEPHAGENPVAGAPVRADTTKGTSP